jgi:hypothetical protein
VSRDSARIMYPTGAEALRAALSLRDTNEAVVRDDSVVQNGRRDVKCPQQTPGGSTVWVKRFGGAQLGCKDTHLSVCRV